VSQQSFYKPVHDNKQFIYSLKPLEKMSKFEKLRELEKLVSKHYAPRDAQTILTMVHVEVFNLGNESLLDDQLSLLRDIERMISR
jgi:hypothetical protein